MSCSSRASRARSSATASLRPRARAAARALERGALAAAAHEDADQPGGEERDGEERAGPQIAGSPAADVAVLERVDRVPDREDREPEPGRAAVRCRRRPSRRRHRARRAARSPRPSCRSRPLGHDACHHERCDEQRPAAPPEQRQREQQRQRRRQPLRAGDGAERPGVPFRDRGDGDDDRGVDRDGSTSAERAGSEMSCHVRTVPPAGAAHILRKAKPVRPCGGSDSAARPQTRDAAPGLALGLRHHDRRRNRCRARSEGAVRRGDDPGTRCWPSCPRSSRRR